LLPHRTHIVVTRDRDYDAQGGLVVHSLEQAIAIAGDVPEMMVVGGANLYAQAVPIASRMYLTYIHADVDGDALFPDFDPVDWVEVSCERHAADARNPHPYSFVVLERRTPGRA
jgi:dihydrofolate reductase